MFTSMGSCKGDHPQSAMPNGTPAAGPLLGIAVTTYSRLRWLRLCVEGIAGKTLTPHHLVVADDGSEDGTVEWCRQAGVRVVTGPNRGVAHNKNRGLLALEALGCDPIFIIEDDLRPGLAGWEREWTAATARWHHVAFANKGIVGTAIRGQGTAADPWASSRTTAQLLTISASALALVGYFDPRFEGWGHEHADWTTRIKRAGYGYRDVTLPDGRPFPAQLFLNHGLISEPAPSWRDDAQSERNRAVGTSIQREPVFRVPWRTTQECAEILGEVRASGVDPDDLAERLEQRARLGATSGCSSTHRRQQAAQRDLDELGHCDGVVALGEAQM
jgi:Glycosyl transferase family 2